MTNTDGLSQGEWIGFANYTRAANDPSFQDSLINTLLLLAALPIWIMLPMLLAILIHQGVPGGNIYRAVYFFPPFYPRNNKTSTLGVRPEHLQRAGEPLSTCLWMLLKN